MKEAVPAPGNHQTSLLAKEKLLQIPEKRVKQDSANHIKTSVTNNDTSDPIKIIVIFLNLRASEASIFLLFTSMPSKLTSLHISKVL